MIIRSPEISDEEDYELRNPFSASREAEDAFKRTIGFRNNDELDYERAYEDPSSMDWYR